MSFQYFDGLLHPKFSSKSGLNLLRVFASIAVVSIIPACVEQSEMTTSSPAQTRNVSAVSMITRETSAVQDWALYTDLGYQSLEGRLIDKCGRFTMSRAYSGYGVRESKKKAAEIKASIDAYPQKVACAEANMQQVSRDFLANVTEHDRAKSLIRQKISAGLYDQSSTEFKYLSGLSPKSHPNFQTFETQSAALEDKIATGLERGRENLSVANRYVRQEQSRRNAWVSAGLSAGIAGATQSASRDLENYRQGQNAIRETAGLPKILSLAEQKALQDAYNWSLANAAKEPLTSSGSRSEESNGASSGGAMLTLTTETPTECTHSLGNSPTPLTIWDCNAYRNQRDIEANEIWEAEQAAKAADIEAERARLAEEKRNAPYDDGCGNIYPNIAAYQAYLNSLPDTDGVRVMCQ